MRVMKTGQRKWTSKDGEYSVYRMLIPVVLELIFTFIISNLNQLILNQFAKEAVAATTAAGTFLSLMINLYSVFYVGQGILLAPCWGRKDYAEGSRIWTVSICDNLLLSIALAGVGVFGSPLILKCLQVPGELQGMAGEYMAVALGLSVFQGVALTFGSAFRAIGDMKTVMLGNTLINGSCVFMNWLILRLIPLEEQRIWQYVMAGIFAQIFGVLFYLWMAGRDERIELRMFHAQWRERFGETTGTIARYGVFGGLEGVIYLVSQTIVMSMIGSLGTEALLVKGYTGNLTNYLTLPASAVSLVAATMIGMSIGMGDEEKAGDCMRKCLKLVLTGTVVLCGGMLLLGRRFLGLYVEEGALAEACMLILAVDMIVEVFRGVAALMVSSLKAIGDVKATFFMVIAGSVLNVGVSWFFGVFLGMGLAGIWIGYGVDLAFRGALGFGIWRKHVRQHSYPVWK